MAAGERSDAGAVTGSLRPQTAGPSGPEQTVVCSPFGEVRVSARRTLHACLPVYACAKGNVAAAPLRLARCYIVR